MTMTSAVHTVANHELDHLTNVTLLSPAPTQFDVAVIGLGYVGLPTALALHGAGQLVLGIDISGERLTAIRTQDVDLLPSDQQRLAQALASENLWFSQDLSMLSRANMVVICVPTPIDDHFLPDLRPLEAACAAVVEHVVSGQVIVLTSTTYVGCTRDFVVKPLQERGLTPGHDIFIAFSPERIDPGNSRHEARAVPRLVGGVTARCTEHAMAALQETAGALVAVSNPETAEMTKLMENTFRAVNIAMANEFADACRVLDIDVTEVIHGAGTKPYGFMAFNPGPGVGGHCIPCDPHYLLWQLRAKRLRTPVIESAMAGIIARPDVIVSQVKSYLDELQVPLSKARILVLGLTYKPNVADVRESPALTIISELLRLGAQVSYHDPLTPEFDFGQQLMHSEPNPQLQQVDLILVHTVHSGQDLSWLAGTAVLDATYSLTGLSKYRTP